MTRGTAEMTGWTIVPHCGTATPDQLATWSRKRRRSKNHEHVSRYRRPIPCRCPLPVALGWLMADHRPEFLRDGAPAHDEKNTLLIPGCFQTSCCINTRCAPWQTKVPFCQACGVPSTSECAPLYGAARNAMRAWRLGTRWIKLHCMYMTGPSLYLPGKRSDGCVQDTKSLLIVAASREIRLRHQTSICIRVSVRPDARRINLPSAGHLAVPMDTGNTKSGHWPGCLLAARRAACTVYVRRCLALPLLVWGLDSRLATAVNGAWSLGRENCY
jgi:hypothetical protein